MLGATLDDRAQCDQRQSDVAWGSATTTKAIEPNIHVPFGVCFTALASPSSTSCQTWLHARELQIVARLGRGCGDNERR